MPKAIVSAEEILGSQTTEVASEDRAPVAEAEAPKESEAPAAGFESPPKEEASAESAPVEEEPAPTEAAESAPVEEEAAQVEAAPEGKGNFQAGMGSIASENSEEPAPTAADVLAKVDEEKEPAKLPAPILNTQAPRPPETKKDEETKTSDPVATPAPVAPSWRFVKNIHPGEKIFLKDGSEYPFPKQGVHTVTDPKVAARLLEVADNYHIVQQ